MAHQTTLSVPIGSEGMGTFLRRLTTSRGLRIRQVLPYPPYPGGLKAPLALDFGGLSANSQHPIQGEGLVPLVLVDDCIVTCSSGLTYESASPIRPYYIHPVLVLDGVPDLREWRRLTTLEAVCCLAQYPQLQWIRYWSTNCSGNICVAYYEGSAIVVKCSTASQIHQSAAYTRAIQNSPPVSMQRTRA